MEQLVINYGPICFRGILRFTISKQVLFVFFQFANILLFLKCSWIVELILFIVYQLFEWIFGQRLCISVLNLANLLNQFISELQPIFGFTFFDFYGICNPTRILLLMLRFEHFLLLYNLLRTLFLFSVISFKTLKHKLIRVE